MRATITAKGQITLPKLIREQLCVSAGDKLDFFVSKEGHLEGVVLKMPANRLKGMLPKPARVVSLDEMDNAIAQGASKS
ncbi:MAG: AbrB/MazE/SpoVT family DNA-binding domain-containing protein [Planctomycetes bacterium]|nr:AbrB/MazE/SpoVT family DNA-binding domain-containing protein [Planctomycetota bacterium]